MFSIPYPVDTFCETSPPWSIRLGWPYMACSNFIELDKAVAQVIRLATLLWLWFQSVCPLMPSLSSCQLTWVSFMLEVRYLLSAPTPDLEQGVSPLGCSLLQFALIVILSFQVPMQNCSVQNWTLLPSPVTSTIGCYFCFGFVSSFFLELVLSDPQ